MRTAIETLTEEDDTAENVGRDTDDEDERIDVADEDVLCGCESLKSDDVIRVVPRKKQFFVTNAFVVTVVDWSLHN